MPMHSVAESAYAAANEWLMSLGDDLDTEMDPEQSTVPSSPSDAYSKNSDSSQASPEYRSMHASYKSRSRSSRVSVRSLSTISAAPKDASDRRMKGDAWLAFWMDGTTRRSKTFSSKALGMEQARVLAIEFLTAKRRGNGPPSPDKRSVGDSEDSEETSIAPILTSRRVTARVAAKESRGLNEGA